jgi:hypothetical protein
MGKKRHHSSSEDSESDDSSSENSTAEFPNNSSGTFVKRKFLKTSPPPQLQKNSRQSIKNKTKFKTISKSETEIFNESRNSSTVESAFINTNKIIFQDFTYQFIRDSKIDLILS